MENFISGNCIEVIGSEIKSLKCLLDSHEGVTFLAHFITSDTSLSSHQECEFAPQVFIETHPYAQDYSSAQRGQQAKGKHNRMARHIPVLTHFTPAEGTLLNPFDTLSWPQNPGKICWHLDMAQPDRLVSVTVSQDHIMSQWTMVASLKHPDMCSTIMQPNQCLWGDEWFQCNHNL